MRWAALSLVGFFLTVMIIAFAVEEAITATTGMDRLEAIGNVFFWLGMAFTTVGLASAGAGYARGGSRRPTASIAIPAFLFGLAAIAFSLAVRS